MKGIEKMKKRICSICLAALATAFVLAPTAQAAAVQEQQIVSYETLEDGVVVKTTLVIHESMLRSSTKRATKIMDYQYDGTDIASVSLTASFGYDGSDAWVNSTSVDHTTYDGWSYGSETVSESGGTANLSAKLTKLFHTTVKVDISITCTANGVIS